MRSGRGAIELLLAGVLAVGVLGASRAEAVTIGLTSAGQVGSVLAVDVEVAGLGAGGAPSLRSFDLDVSYDAGLVSFLDVTFDDFLGTGAQVLTDENDLGTAVDLAAVSLLATATLHAGQPAAFRLATLHFAVVGTGLAAFDFAQTLLGDTGGAALALSSATGASVSVAAASVPEPSRALLLAAALAALAAARSLCSLLGASSLVR